MSGNNLETVRSSLRLIRHKYRGTSEKSIVPEKPRKSPRSPGNYRSIRNNSRTSLEAVSMNAQRPNEKSREVIVVRYKFISATLLLRRTFNSPTTNKNVTTYYHNTTADLFSIFSRERGLTWEASVAVCRLIENVTKPELDIAEPYSFARICSFNLTAFLF